MRLFLDMCVPLYYAGEGDKPTLNKKARDLVDRKESQRFLLCEYILKVDIPKWIKRQRIFLNEIIRKLKDSSYVLYGSDESSRLTNRDRQKMIKFLSMVEKYKKNEAISRIEKIFYELERRVNHFLNSYVDEVVIPVNEIDFNLKSCLFTWLAPNDSDSKTIASAIQEHNKKELTILTADKKDITSELLEEVHNDIFLKKRYPKLPEIKYL